MKELRVISRNGLGKQIVAISVLRKKSTGGNVKAGDVIKGEHVSKGEEV